jgi:hypothetical protein
MVVGCDGVWLSHRVLCWLTLFLWELEMRKRLFRIHIDVPGETSIYANVYSVHHRVRNLFDDLERDLAPRAVVQIKRIDADCAIIEVTVKHKREYRDIGRALGAELKRQYFSHVRVEEALVDEP